LPKSPILPKIAKIENQNLCHTEEMKQPEEDSRQVSSALSNLTHADRGSASLLAISAILAIAYLAFVFLRVLCG